MPAPQGQTFFVVADGGMAHNGGLEFQRYAGLVAQQLQSRGYRAGGKCAERQHGRPVRLWRRSRPGPLCRRRPASARRAIGYGGYFGRRSLYRPRFGWGIGCGYGWGWDDPFWYGDNVDSYVEYHSQIDLHIRAAGSNAALFDGRAQARSETNRLDVVIPSLVDAMFTGFPGRNGEVVKITIPTRQPPHG